MILAQIEINNMPKNVNMISNYGDYAAKEINNGFVIRIWR